MAGLEWAAEMALQLWEQHWQPAAVKHLAGAAHLLQQAIFDRVATQCFVRQVTGGS
jgi:hypothetical protein